MENKVSQCIEEYRADESKKGTAVNDECNRNVGKFFLCMSKKLVLSCPSEHHVNVDRCEKDWKDAKD